MSEWAQTSHFWSPLLSSFAAVRLQPQLPQNLSPGKTPPDLHFGHFVLVAGRKGPFTICAPHFLQNGSKHTPESSCATLSQPLGQNIASIFIFLTRCYLFAKLRYKNITAKFYFCQTKTTPPKRGYFKNLFSNLLPFPSAACRDYAFRLFWEVPKQQLQL